MIIKTQYGVHDLQPRRGEYTQGGLGIHLYEKGEPFCALTVWLEPLADPTEAFVDTNNFPEAEEFIRIHKLGTFTGTTAYSGFCEYPLYRFDLSKIVVKL